MTQQAKLVQTMAVRAAARLVIPSEQQRILEQNSITLPRAPDAPITTPTQRACTHPAVDCPPRYSVQHDDTWARQEFFGNVA